MAGTVRSIRRVQTAKIADFDDQLWPINCALLILAGFVTGIVIATSDFTDSRLLYNGWIRLVSVALIVGLLFWGSMWLQGKMRRRLQFCLLISLLVHVWLAMVLHQQYLALLARREAESARQVTEPHELITEPDYFWEPIEKPEVQQSYERPIETEAPKPMEPEAVRHGAKQPEMPTDVKSPEQPEVPQRQQPNPLLTRRAELSAPRRAPTAAGVRISRQEQKIQPLPNQPVPQPQIEPRPQATVVLPGTDFPRHAAEPSEPRVDQREANRQPSVPQPEPADLALARRPNVPEPVDDAAERPTPNRQANRPANVPRGGPLVPEPVQLAQRDELPEPTFAQARAIRRQAEQPTPSEASQRATDVPDRPAPSAMVRSSTRRTQPPPRPSSEPRAARPTSLARFGRGVELPSTAVPVPSQPASTAAAVGGSPASGLRLASSAAVQHSASESTSDLVAAAAGPADYAVGSSDVVARIGQPRAFGLGRPSATARASIARLALADGQAVMTAAQGVAQPTPAAATGAAAAGPGGSSTPLLGMEDSAVRRGAPPSQLAAEPLAGSGQATSSGMVGPIASAQSRRPTRHEPIDLASGGGGSPRPRPTTLGAVLRDAMAEASSVAAGDSGGASAAQAGEAFAASTGPRRQASGLPGSVLSQPRTGAVASLSSDAAPWSSAVARRAGAASQRPDGRNTGARGNVTLTRANNGIDLPTAAVPVDDVAEPGAAGVAVAQGGLPSSLQEGTSPAIRRAAAEAGLPGDAVTQAALEGAMASAPTGTAVSTGAAPGATAGRRRLAGADQPGLLPTGETRRGPLSGQQIAALPRGMADATEEPMAVAAVGPKVDADPLATADGAGLDQPGRQQGGLPVQIAAVAGPGGLGYDPSPDVGLPSRRARRESDVIHTAARRFVVDRSGGQLAIDGRVRELPGEAFRQRDVGRRGEIAQAYGGSEGTEMAVEMGLDFFARTQFPDGHWSLHELPPGLQLEDPALGQMESDTAATGLALLSYLGAGYTHLDDKHQAVVDRGIDWLVRNQKNDGDLFSGGTKYAWFYSHGIAAIALCEAYGMTRDEELLEPARKAVDFIVKTQHPTRGGWRYYLDDKGTSIETDTSVTGWQLMALKSAQMAGLDVPEESLEGIDRWLDQAAAPSHPGRYVYNPQAQNTPEQRAGRQPNLAMTSEAMLMRMYLGHQRDDAQLIAGADYLKENLPEVGTASRPLRDCYYWYYATQAMFHMQDDYWTAWNERFRALAQGSQVQFGPATGSWHPRRPIADRWGHAGGRHYVTALHLLMLEVYYRHLPLFKELRR